MIALQDVSVDLGRTAVLRHVTLHLEPGTTTAVVGPNGGGKSTLLGVISGRVRQSAGSVRVGGDVADVLQSTTVDPQLRLLVEDVVRMGRYPSLGLLGRHRSADREQVRAALDRVGLLGLRRRPFGELSGGQRQRVLIAQGLAQGAPILLLDEPSSALDARSRCAIVEILDEEAAAGRTIVFSTHHRDEAEAADSVVAVAVECLCCATPDEAFARPTVAALLPDHASPVR
ncbi:MAG: metal ABC transporter ATP-binding protein [Acidimicrobiales bacterium]